MKKTVTLLIALVMMVSIFTGCQTEPASTPEPAKTSEKVEQATDAQETSVAEEPAEENNAPEVGDTIKIGYIDTLTTTLAASLPWVDVGFNLAIKTINDNGGINGKQIEVIKKDSANDPAITVERMQELKDEGVVALIGPSSDSLSPTAAQWCEENQMVSIQTGTASTKAYIDNATKYFFYSGFNAWQISKVLALNTVEQLDASSFSFVGTDGAAGIDIQSFYLQEARKINPAFTSRGDFRISTTNTEFSTVVSALNATQPDILVGGIAGPLFISFVEQAELFDLFSTVDYYGWYTTDASNTQGFGEDYPAGHTHGVIAMPFWVQETEQQKQFIEDWYAMGEELGYEFTVHPCDLGYGAYKGLMSLAAAIEIADDYSSDAIAEAMHEIELQLPWGDAASYRKIDNMLITTVWYGTTAWDDNFVTPIGVDTVECGLDTYPAEEDILAVAKERGVDLKERLGLN